MCYEWGKSQNGYFSVKLKWNIFWQWRQPLKSLFRAK